MKTLLYQFQTGRTDGIFDCVLSNRKIIPINSCYNHFLQRFNFSADSTWVFLKRYTRSWLERWHNYVTLTNINLFNPLVSTSITSLLSLSIFLKSSIQTLLYLIIFSPLVISRNVFIYLMTKLTNYWGFQHLLNRPTSLYAIFKKSSLKSFFSSPLSKWFSFSFIGQKMIIRPIKVLFPQSRPTAILPVIINIGVNAVNSCISFAKLITMDLITCIHFFVENIKIKPFFSDRNTSPAITLEAIMSWIQAPLFHRTPYLIESCPRHSVLHNLSLANGGATVNQFYTPLWITKSQLTDFYNKVKGKKP